jgi:hypothetical protein
MGDDAEVGGTKLILVVPEGVEPGQDILFTSPSGRDLNVRSHRPLAQPPLLSSLRSLRSPAL